LRIFFQNGFHYVLAQLFYSKGGIDEYQYIVYLNVPTLYGTFWKNEKWRSLLTKNANKKQKHQLNEIVFAFLFQSCGHATYKMFNQWGVGIGPTCFTPWGQTCFEPFPSFIMFSRHKTHSWFQIVNGYVCCKTWPNKAPSKQQILLQETL
jgi:hypothetical protein